MRRDDRRREHVPRQRPARHLGHDPTGSGARGTGASGSTAGAGTVFAGGASLGGGMKISRFGSPMTPTVPLLSVAPPRSVRSPRRGSGGGRRSVRPLHGSTPTRAGHRPVFGGPVAGVPAAGGLGGGPAGGRCGAGAGPSPSAMWRLRISRDLAGVGLVEERRSRRGCGAGSIRPAASIASTAAGRRTSRRSGRRSRSGG